MTFETTDGIASSLEHLLICLNRGAKLVTTRPVKDARGWLVSANGITPAWHNANVPYFTSKATTQNARKP